MSAFAEGDPEGVAALYTDDAVLLAPQRAMLEGRGAVEAFMRGAMEQGVTEIDLESVEVVGLGDTAYEMGEYELFAGDRRVDRGKYLVVWRKESDGWKLHRDMMNTSVPQQTGPEPSAVHGEWRGTVTQRGYGDYPVEMIVEGLERGEAAGVVNYHSLDCSAELTYEGRGEETYIFSERKTKGRCLEGRIEVRPLDGNELEWNWYAQRAQEPLVTGTLSQ